MHIDTLRVCEYRARFFSVFACVLQAKLEAQEKKAGKLEAEAARYRAALTDAPLVSQVHARFVICMLRLLFLRASRRLFRLCDNSPLPPFAGLSADTTR